MTKINKSKMLAIIFSAFIFVTCLTLYYFFNSEKDIVKRGVYDHNFTVHLRATCSEAGFLDVLYKRKVYLVKDGRDSIEIKLRPSEFIAVTINTDTIIQHGVQKQIFVLGQVDGGFETLVDKDSLKIIDNYFISVRVKERQIHGNATIFPRDYKKIHEPNR